MLLLAGVKFVFFTVASVELFWICAVDNSGMIFFFLLNGAYTQPRPFLLLRTPPVSRIGVQGIRRGHNKDSCPQMTQGISQTSWSHGQCTELGKEGGMRTHSKWWCLSSHIIITSDGALHSWGWLSTCQPLESGKWIPCFAFLFACTASYFPNSLSSSQFTSFLTFDSLFHPTGWKQEAVWGLVAIWGYTTAFSIKYFPIQ